MKIRLIIFVGILCLGGLGCEMHPARPMEHSDENRPSPEFQKALQPEPANPHPPSFFPTPKSS